MPYGTGLLWWLGQMGLLIKLGNTLLCVDYFASETPSRRTKIPIPVGELEGVNVILGSHDHSDHIDRPAWRVWNKTCRGAKFVFPRMHFSSLTNGILDADKCIGLNDGESVCIGDVRVHAVAAAHEFLAKDAETGLYPCLQYVIEGNGLRIYHAGDTLRYEGMLPSLQRLGSIDAALLPINGRDAVRYARNCIGNMTYQEATDLAGELRPALVIPGHWDMFRDNSGDPEAFKAYLEVKYPLGPKCIIPECAKPIRLSARI